jgi:hypothetical protein
VDIGSVFKGDTLRNIAFVIWMVGMSLGKTFSEYVDAYLLGRRYSDNVDLMADIVWLIIWFGVGIKLYEPKKGE